MQRLKHSTATARRLALEALAVVARQGDNSMTAAICQALNDSDVQIQESALHALAIQAGKDDPGAIKAASTFLLSEHMNLRTSAIAALNKIVSHNAALHDNVSSDFE